MQQYAYGIILKANSCTWKRFVHPKMKTWTKRSALLQFTQLRMAVNLQLFYWTSNFSHIHPRAAIILFYCCYTRCQEILIYCITLEPVKFESQQLILNCSPLAATFTEDGVLYVMTDDKSAPIQSFHMDHDFKFIPFKSSVVQQLVDDESHLKFLQGNFLLPKMKLIQCWFMFCWNCSRCLSFVRRWSETSLQAMVRQCTGIPATEERSLGQSIGIVRCFHNETSSCRIIACAIQI